MFEKLKAQLSALPQWQRLFLLVGLPIVLTVYIWLMLLSPAMDELEKLRKEKQQISQDIENIRRSMDPALLKNLESQKEELAKELERKEAELIALVGTIPTQKDAGLVIREIGRLARKNGVSLLSLQVQSPQKTVYALEVVGDKKVVKEVQPQQQAQQQPQQPQQSQQPQQQPQQQAEVKPTQGVEYLKSEVRLSVSGSYRALRSFLADLEKGGIISYPASVSLADDGKRVRGELTLYILMKEEEKQ